MRTEPTDLPAAPQGEAALGHALREGLERQPPSPVAIEVLRYLERTRPGELDALLGAP